MTRRRTGWPWGQAPRAASCRPAGSRLTTSACHSAGLVWRLYGDQGVAFSFMGALSLTAAHWFLALLARLPAIGGTRQPQPGTRPLPPRASRRRGFRVAARALEPCRALLEPMERHRRASRMLPADLACHLVLPDLLDRRLRIDRPSAEIRHRRRNGTEEQSWRFGRMSSAPTSHFVTERRVFWTDLSRPVIPGCHVTIAHAETSPTQEAGVHWIAGSRGRRGPAGQVRASARLHRSVTG